MYDKTFAIDTADLDQASVVAYLTTMFKALGGAVNTKSGTLAQMLKLDGADAFRFVTGAPQEWLTTPNQRFAEAAFALTFDCSVAQAHQRWVEGVSWSPRNPRAHDELATGCLDLEFLDQFGLSTSSWETAFNMTGILARCARRIDSEADRIRAVVSLSMLGFTDPMQFFTRR